MRRVVLVARCLIGGAMTGCLSAGLAPVNAQEWPIETASLSKPILPAAVAPVRRAKKKSCAGVIGTSRTMVADATMPQRIGRMQYKTSLPLNDHEVVLTFDDGPIRPHTSRVLDTLAANCVKATFFLVGSMARAYPGLVRRIYNEGHSIGTHSHRHPLTFDRMAKAAIAREVNAGIASVQKAAGDPRVVAPFFRVPGLARSRTVDSYLAARSLSEWSADAVADDWHHGISARQIVQRAMRRLAGRDHRGVLLLHDIHAHTARAVPLLLAALKAKGYRIVHVTPAGARPKSVPPLPGTMIAHARPHRHKAAHTRHRRHLTRFARHRKATRWRHRSSAQALSALRHKKHRIQTAVRDAQKTALDW